jgi:flagellar protein FlaG
MNEVRMSTAVNPVVARPASSKGGDAEAVVPEVGKTQPSTPVDAQASEPVTVAQDSKPERVKNAVASINEYVQSINRDLQFTIDEDTERTVIKVIDSQSGELIRQIPDEVFLELARRLDEDGEFQLIDALG